jgi:hypothetical protein
MLRIAVSVLAVLAVGYGATAQSHGFKADRAAQTGAFASERVAAHVTPIVSRNFPDVVTLISEED